MVEFYYIKCLQLTSEIRARNQTFWGEMDEISVIWDVENTELSFLGGHTERMEKNRRKLCCTVHQVEE